ncbi:MAG TPA: hypothetical protein VNN74_06955 [Candidatus Micrarchaeia archaeon]|nr:hypothetical protein [Candidatus Micrarchaeia archaeon]
MAGTAALDRLEPLEEPETLGWAAGAGAGAGPAGVSALRTRPERLRQAVRACQVRYGAVALRTGVDAVRAQGLSTGIAALDRLTGVGGLPRGRITLLEGPAGAGTVALGLAALAAASREDPVALVDFSHTVDPADLLAYQGTLGRLWVVRPRQPLEGWAAVRALVRAGVRACLAVAGPRALALAPSALLPTLAETLAVCTVVGGPQAPGPWRVASSLTLACEPRGWWWVHGDIAGVDLACTVGKHRCGPAGGRLCLRVRFPRPYPPGAGVEALAAAPGAG